MINVHNPLTYNNNYLSSQHLEVVGSQNNAQDIHIRQILQGMIDRYYL